MTEERPTKKDAKNALKFALNAPGAACPPCKGELIKFLQQLGKDWSDGIEQSYTITLTGGHVVFNTPVSDHAVIPVIAQDPLSQDAIKARKKARREARLAKKKEEAAAAAGVEAVEESTEDSE